MNHILTIHEEGENGKTVVLISLGELDPKTAAMTVLDALRSIRPRKPRSDKGVKKAVQP